MYVSELSVGKCCVDIKTEPSLGDKWQKASGKCGTEPLRHLREWHFRQREIRSQCPEVGMWLTYSGATGRQQLL